VVGTYSAHVSPQSLAIELAFVAASLSAVAAADEVDGVETGWTYRHRWGLGSMALIACAALPFNPSSVTLPRRDRQRVPR
jgi:hypothetical protein